MAEERRRRSTLVGPGGDDMHREKNVMKDIGSIDSAGLAAELRWCLSGDIQLLPLALAAKLHVMPSFLPPRLQPSHHISLIFGHQTTCPFTSIL